MPVVGPIGVDPHPSYGAAVDAAAGVTVPVVVPLRSRRGLDLRGGPAAPPPRPRPRPVPVPVVDSDTMGTPSVDVAAPTLVLLGVPMGGSGGSMGSAARARATRALDSAIALRAASALSSAAAARAAPDTA